jgi:hypothetical protein
LIALILEFANSIRMASAEVLSSRAGNMVGKLEIRNYNPTVCFSLNSNIGEPLMPILLSVSAGDLDGDALQELTSRFIERAK